MADNHTYTHGEIMAMTEEDVKQNFITPALYDAKWERHQLQMEHYFTDGRVLAQGAFVTRMNKGKKADYQLHIEHNYPIAIIEAKDAHQSVSAGMQQALEYGEILDIPFVFSSNGLQFRMHNRLTGEEKTIGMHEFPTPDDLRQLLQDCKGYTPEEQKLISQPYYSDMNTYEPRYYQRIAINRTIEAVARGQQRLLLVMATGTGKTYTAFQIIHRLHESGTKKKILYLADRNVLINQTIDKDFKPFKKIITKVQNKKIDDSYEIFMSLYGQLVSYDEETPDPFTEFSPDFFDLIIVDECHRGSVRDDSEWKRILEYFSSATQIGMTATPKSVEGADNLEYFGEPLYTYTLKDGIEDGFLAPYRVTKSFINIDLEGWVPEENEKDLFGNLIEKMRYNRADFGRKLAIELRRKVVALRITTMLKQIGRMTKTIVFCEDQEEASLMRDELYSLNQDLCKKDHRYIMRITSDDAEGKKQLGNFIDSNEPYPTIVTTSKLLDTGVDCKMCGLIVLDKEITSMTTFKQIVGRGTRIDEKRGKMHFEILDFRNVTAKFSDKEFDGVADETGRFTYKKKEPKDLENFIVKETDPEPSSKSIKYHIKGKDITIAYEKVEYLGTDGKMITESLTDYTRKTIRSRFATLNDFIRHWNEAERKAAILDELQEEAVLIDAVRKENPRLEDSDAFDIICHVAFDQKPLTRRERVENVKKRNYLAKYEGKAREVLENLLDKYADSGIRQLESKEILNLNPFDQIGRPPKITAIFGGQAGYEKARAELEAQLYASLG